MKNYFILIFSICLLFACETKQEPKTIYIVRHAEKKLDSNDPLLSYAGTVRSKKLAQILADKKIEHLYTTNTIRTIATAQPLADQLNMEIKLYDAKKQDNLARELKILKGNVLVVGHSNSVPHLANYFQENGVPYKELEDIEYNFIFIVDLKADGTSSVQRKVFKEF